jgi:hypothetical protein
MLAQVKRQTVTRDLHVDRKVRLETMLPIDLEAEKIEIELASLVDRENAEDGHNAAELDCHRSSLRLAACRQIQPQSGFRDLCSAVGRAALSSAPRSNDG